MQLSYISAAYNFGTIRQYQSAYLSVFSVNCAAICPNYVLDNFFFPTKVNIKFV